jgi:hypothetical protein
LHQIKALRDPIGAKIWEKEGILPQYGIAHVDKIPTHSFFVGKGNQWKINPFLTGKQKNY